MARWVEHRGAWAEGLGIWGERRKECERVEEEKTGAVDGFNLQKKGRNVVFTSLWGTCQQEMKIHFTDRFRKGFQNCSLPPCLNA